MYLSGRKFNKNEEEVKAEEAEHDVIL